MSVLGRAAATRSNLVRLARRREQVARGAALLRKKRESLVAELFARAKPAVDSRRAIEEEAAAAYRELLEALAVSSSADVRAMGLPVREVRAEVTARDVWGIRGVALARKPSLVRSFAARGVAAGPGDAAAVGAAERFERLLEQVLAAAPDEIFLRRIGRALAQTTRLVNTLERRVATSLGHEAAVMRRTLEEREREEHLRLKRFGSGR